jgi:S-DNA-T family DNA segregation ATPase FtsK/SpoIIIE
MSVVLWLITRSPYTLMFAALGPGIAVASLVDSRIGSRRRARIEHSRFAAELAQVRNEIAAEHERERATLSSEAPSAAQLLLGPEHVRWGGTAPEVVRLGLASRPSQLAIDGSATARGSDPSSVRLRALREEALTLLDAPLVARLGSGIGIAGPPIESAALARAILVQVLASRSPARFRVRGGDDWLAAIPHQREPGDGDVVEVHDETTRIIIAVARDPATLPSVVQTVVRLEGTGARVLRGEPILEFRPELLSTEQALQWAEHAAAVARRLGISALHGGMPTCASFAELPVVAGRAGLSCPVGLDAAGPVLIDLVADGPHAIVGGTTGSGKSELLITWLLSMASSHSPAEATFLLFDFKGGSSFGAVASLPHCVGLITDLDGESVARAVASLAAELRYRERVLAAASARSIEQVEGLPRLVIVVDEFAAMAADLPELHAQFADLAARGRSLGVHLVLCTQRPAGVVRDAVLANASLRVSLRVNNRADSVAVIGTGDAATEHTLQPGRAWLARAGAAPTPVQVAIAGPDDVAAVGALWPESEQGRRPWLDPLPNVLVHAGEPGVIGLIDLPAEQSQPALRWSPVADGNLLALGGARSGRTTLLQAVALGIGGVLVDDNPEALWDAVLAPPSPIVLIDDLDLLVARMPVDYQHAFIDELATAMRGTATRFAVTAQRLSSAIQQLSALFDERILLRMPNRQEHLIAGGSAQGFDPDLPPGAGYWRESRVQIALAPPVPRIARATSARFVPLGRTIAVSPRATALAARLAAAGFDVATDPHAAPGRASTSVLVTDPDGWQANWAVYSALAKQHAVLFYDCSLAEFRQLSRQRALPPLIVDSRTMAWLLTPEGEISRVSI